MEKTKLLIDIDSLFDTRQGKLRILLNDDEKVAEYVNSEEYNFRKIDDFSSIVDMDKYNSLSNDINVIKNSIITYNLEVLKQKIFSLDYRNAYLQKPYAFEVLLNFYGYELKPSEEKLIINALYAKMNVDCFIIPVRLSEKELIPSFINNSDFAYIFIYESRKWLDYNIVNLENITLDKTILYFPSIYYNNSVDINQEEEKIRKMGFNDAFNFIEFILSEKMKMNFLPIFFYSNIITSQMYLKYANSILKESSLKGEK